MNKEDYKMPIIVDQFNTLYIGGSRGHKFEVRFCPKNVTAPWCVSSRGQGHYFTTLGETLAFAAGRGWISSHEIRAYQNEISAALDSKWDE
jgi:hypothetical protein